MQHLEVNSQVSLRLIRKGRSKEEEKGEKEEVLCNRIKRGENKEAEKEAVVFINPKMSGLGGYSLMKFTNFKSYSWVLKVPGNSS